jgi:hypothetical protein
VILGSELTESVHTGFKICNDYWGYHSFLTTTLGKIYYAAVGMPLKCPACITIGLQTAERSATLTASTGQVFKTHNKFGKTVARRDVNVTRRATSNLVYKMGAKILDGSVTIIRTTF